MPLLNALSIAYYSRKVRRHPGDWKVLSRLQDAIDQRALSLRLVCKPDEAVRLLTRHGEFLQSLAADRYHQARGQWLWSSPHNAPSLFEAADLPFHLQSEATISSGQKEAIYLLQDARALFTQSASYLAGAAELSRRMSKTPEAASLFSQAARMACWAADPKEEISLLEKASELYLQLNLAQQALASIQTAFSASRAKLPFSAIRLSNTLLRISAESGLNLCDNVPDLALRAWLGRNEATDARIAQAADQVVSQFGFYHLAVAWRALLHKPVAAPPVRRSPVLKIGFDAFHAPLSSISHLNGKNGESNGHATPATNGHATPATNGHATPATNGHATPATNGHANAVPVQPNVKIRIAKLQPVPVPAPKMAALMDGAVHAPTDPELRASALKYLAARLPAPPVVPPEKRLRSRQPVLRLGFEAFKQPLSPPPPPRTLGLLMR